MTQEKFFSIIVDGRLSSEAEEPLDENVFGAPLDKESGQPKGPTVKVRLQQGGTSIPNFSKVWAKRIKDKKTEKPTGELEFLKWGHKDGELVQIRYLEGVGTLDKIHQDTVLNIGPKSEEEKNQTAYIDLNIGVNDYDVETADPMLVEMLKRHTYNGDNESRNPNSREIKYTVYNPKKVNGKKVEEMRAEQKAREIILNAEGDTQKLAILAVIFDMDPRSQNEILFNQLLDILDDDWKRVNDAVEHHQARFRHILTKLEDAGELEYTDTAVKVTIDHSTEFLAQNIEAKDKKMYLVANMLEPDFYPVYEKALEIDRKLVEQLN